MDSHNKVIGWFVQPAKIREKEKKNMEKIYVEYDSRMNEIHFDKFTGTELNLFMAISAAVKGCGDDLRVINVAMLKKEACVQSGGKNRDFYTMIKKLSEKLAQIRVQFEELKPGERKFEIANLFETLKYSESDFENLYVRVNPDYTWIFNEIERFTKFELERFTSIKSKHGKNLYRVLMQFKNSKNAKGYYDVEIDKFKKVLGISENTPVKKIKPIVQKAMEDIVSVDEDFSGYVYHTQKSSLHGNPITRVGIYWGKGAKEFLRQRKIQKNSEEQNDNKEKILFIKVPQERKEKGVD